MAIPKYNELYVPFLHALTDGRVHTLKEIKETVADALQLTEDELSERIQSNKQTLIDNRLGWARTYLKKAGLLISEKKAHFQISEEGKHLLAEGVPITNELLAERYPLLRNLSIIKARLIRQPCKRPLKTKPKRLRKRWNAFFKRSIINCPMICCRKS